MDWELSDQNDEGFIIETDPPCVALEDCEKDAKSLRWVGEWVARKEVSALLELLVTWVARP